jgi:hypothetical protein
MINFKDRRLIIVAVAIACVSAGLGIFIGSFIPKSKTGINNPYYEELIEEFDDQLGLKLITENLNEKNIKNHLKYEFKKKTTIKYFRRKLTKYYIEF